MLPQVTFRGLSPSSTVMDMVCRKARKLADVAPQLRSCHAVIEASPRGAPRPTEFRVSLQLVTGAEPARRNAHAVNANLYGALRDAFRAARRQLEPRDRHVRGDADSHAPVPR